MAVIKLKNLQKLRKLFPDKKIVFCSGVFDLTHTGHVLFLESCKKLGDILVVGIGSDKSVKRYKGEQRPIYNQHIRLKLIDSLKPVDYCFMDDDIYEKNDPLLLIKFTFKQLKPDIYVFNRDAYDIKGRMNLAKAHGIRIKLCKRNCPKVYEHISTTQIIEKIRKFSADKQ